MTNMYQLGDSSDDSWPSSSDDSSSSDSDDASTTISDPRDYDKEPEWMKKFDLAKSIKSNSDAGTAVSETRSKSQNSKPTDWMKKFEQAKDGRSMTTTSLPTKLNDRKDSDWMKKFERSKDERSSTTSTVSTNTPLPTKENTPLLTRENENESDFLKGKDEQSSTNSPSSTTTPFSTKENDKNSDWLQKFEGAKDKEQSTNVSLLTDDVDQGESDGVGEKNLKSLDSSVGPNTTKASKSVNEAEKNEVITSRPKKYNKPANVDKSERRERIRRNLEKLRRRERIRKNLGTIQAKNKKDQPESIEESENKEQRENDAPTMSSRMRKYERAIFKGMQKKAPSNDKNNRGPPMTSITTNQPAAKQKFAPKTNKQNSWNVTKKANYNPPTTERNKWFSPLNNTFIGGKQEAPPKQKFSDTNKQQKPEAKKQKVRSVVKVLQSPSQKDIVKVPSIKSKMNALNQAIKKSNVNENKSYLQSPRQKLADTSKHRNNEFVKQTVEAVANSAPSAVQKEVVKVSSIESKMNALNQALYKSNTNQNASFQKSPQQKKLSMKMQQVNNLSKQKAANFVKSAPAPSQKAIVKVSSIEEKMNALNQALYKSNTNQNTSYQKSPQQKSLDTKKQIKKVSGQNIANAVMTTPTPSQKEVIKAPSSIESKKNALDQALFKSSINQNASYQKSPQPTTPIPSQKEVIKAPSSIESKKNALDQALFKSSINQNASSVKNTKTASAAKSRNVNSNSATPSHKAPSPKTTHRKTGPRRPKAPSPKVTHRKTGSSSTKDVPEKEIPKSKAHVSRAEIENSVPENLFGMWGETVRAKKPVTDSPIYSDGDVKKRANKIKERIEKAKREAMGASGGHNRNKVEVNSGTKEDTDGDSSASEDAAALFHAAGSKNSDDEECDYEEIIEYYSGESDEGALDDDAAALFHAPGSAKKNVEHDVTDLDYDIEEYEEEILEDVTESEMADTVDEYPSPAKNVQKNRLDKFESKADDLDDETSVDYDESEMADTMDEYPSPAKNFEKNRLDKFGSKEDEESSVDYDESEMADTMDEYPSPAKNMGKNRLDKSEPKKDESEIDLDATMNSGILSPSPTKNKPRSYRNKNKLKAKKSDAQLSMGGIAPFYGSSFGKYKNAPDYSSSSSNRLDDDVPLDRNTSNESLLNDSFSSSSDSYIPEKELKKAPTQKEVSEWVLEKTSNHEVKTEDTRQSEKDEENGFYDNSNNYAMSKYKIPNSNAVSTFDDDGSFFASDFSDASFENVKPREVGKVEKKAKKSKKSKSKKTKSKKNLKSKKKDKKRK